MKQFSIAYADRIVDRNTYGGKAYWLSWLINSGYRVPDCFFLPGLGNGHGLEGLSTLEKNPEFKELLQKMASTSGGYDIAIRSSAIKEDSQNESYAGHFKSFVDNYQYEDVIGRIREVVESRKSVEDKDNAMGVVLQKKITPSYSGVIFSSNPLNCSKAELLVSFTEGMGEQLVSGKVAGVDLLINYSDGVFEIPKVKEDINLQKLHEVCAIAKEIESKLKIPVDIEWCIDKQSGELNLLQCRPITTILPKQSGVIPINLLNEQLFPEQVRENDKIKIRLLAQRNKIDISNAYLVVGNEKCSVDESFLSQIFPDDRCCSYSVVLLFPKRIGGSIIRHFAEIEAPKQNSAYRPCQRYNVRSYRDQEQLKETIKTILTKCCEQSWTCIAIIQEIFEPCFTGVVKKIGDGYLVEVGKGHFIPKGVVPTSQYVLDRELSTTFKNEITQEYYYRISNGEVIKEQYNKEITIGEADLQGIVRDLEPVLASGKQAVEFGLLKSGERLAPYLIDLVDDNTQAELSSALLSQGVISPGFRKGKARFIDTNAIGLNSLELHFHNEINSSSLLEDELIFVAKTPDIALLEILKLYNSEKIGFIFSEGSALAHLSIVLREKNIPAIVLADHSTIKENHMLKIDASKEGLEARNRIQHGNTCVTSYVNPDADGICTSIAFKHYSEKQGKIVSPVYFGNLDSETEYIINHFGIDRPARVTSVGDFSEIVLVDTHHISQISKEISPSNVIEIIDHHPAGNPEAFPNAIIKNEKIGAACTIIAERMKSEAIIPEAKIAGMMALAIVSNTLNFSAPSSTQRDRDAYEWLNKIMKISDEVIKEMFSARSDVSGIATNELMRKNVKEFNFSGKKFAIIQIELAEVEQVTQRSDFIKTLFDLQKELVLDHILFSGVDIVKHSTTITCLDNATLEIVNKAMSLGGHELEFEVNRILLRKTDFIPAFTSYFASQR